MNSTSQGRATPPTVRFWGAARTVTGSMHIVEANGRLILLDCGLFQGHRSEARERNSHFPFRPRDVDAVILSHAHVDHCGNLPNLVRQGFAGPIYCTPATGDLTAVMLADSAKIQEEDAEHLNKHRGRGESLVQPLYTRRDAIATSRHVHGVPYDRDHDLGGGVVVRFVDAGHILGSAMVALTISSGGRDSRLTFTGDLGRRGLPILRDPAPVPPGEVLISESTYGGQTHPPVEELAETLAAAVRRTADRGGKVLIPAFSLGRTQNVIYFFHQLFQSGRLSPLPIYVDSPLAASATEVFRLHPECFDDETAALLQEDASLFGEERVRFMRTVNESRQLNDLPGPAVIIAASGMCEAGRILHHLKHHIEDSRTTVLVVGFQAPDTLGRRIVERRPEVRIFDRMYKLRAEVVTLNGLSSHADHQDLLRALGPLAGTARHVRLVHGEPERAEALAAGLREQGFSEVLIPDRGDSLTLD